MFLKNTNIFFSYIESQCLSYCLYMLDKKNKHKLH